MKPSDSVISSKSPSACRPTRREQLDLRRRLLQLDQHAVRRRRVNERDQRAFGAGPRLLVDQPDAARAQVRERRLDVVDAQRDVMQAGAALLDELRDRRVGRGRFEQLERRLAGVEEMWRGRAATRSPRWPRRAGPSTSLKNASEACRSLDRDPDVIENGFHRLPSRLRSRALARISEAAVYGSTSRLAMRSTSASNSPAPSSAVLDVLHEAMRQQIAQAEFVARLRAAWRACLPSARETP